MDDVGETGTAVQIGGEVNEDDESGEDEMPVKEVDNSQSGLKPE